MACSQWPQCGDYEGNTVCDFDADPDVAGIGVLVSFLVSGWLAFVLVLFAFFYVQDAIPDAAVNRLDEIVIRNARRVAAFVLKRFIKTPLSQDKWPETPRVMEFIESIMLVFSDQQLVTGFAMLSVAFAKTKTITEYHFEIATDLAWLSLSVHQCTIDVLSDYIRENSAMGILRSIAIFLEFLLLFASVILTWSGLWLASYGTPAICIWSHLSESYSWSSTWDKVYMAFNLIILVWAAAVTIQGMLPLGILEPVLRIRTLVRDALVQKLQSVQTYQINFTKKASLSNGIVAISAWSILAGCIYITSTVGFVLFEIVVSESFDLLRVWGILLFYSRLVFRWHSYASFNGRQGSENDWGFGQAVAVFLLGLLIFNVVEVYYDVFIKPDKNGETIEGSQSDQAESNPAAASESQLSSPILVDGQLYTAEPGEISSAIELRSYRGILRRAIHQDTESRGSYARNGTYYKYRVGVHKLQTTQRFSTPPTTYDIIDQTWGRPKSDMFLSTFDVINQTWGGGTVQTSVLTQKQVTRSEFGVYLYTRFWFRALLGSLMLGLYAVVTWLAIGGIVV